ncbi:hypothetical protein Tco_0750763 [Tanacetum coccineum]|uniref:Uncharacterized protein n=1 Tax=Tanacetum coccineum TaxID=301880 RepID=A0ABQ4Z5B8_9ASTR
MGGPSSQPRTPINVFQVEELYTPEFLDFFQENTGYWQQPEPHESPIEQVVTSPTKKNKAIRNRQKRTIESDDAPRQTAWTTEEEIALAKGWLAVSENNKHVVLADYVSAGHVLVPAGSSSNVPADYVSAGHVLVPADRDRIC